MSMAGISEVVCVSPSNNESICSAMKDFRSFIFLILPMAIWFQHQMCVYWIYHKTCLSTEIQIVTLMVEIYIFKSKSTNHSIRIKFGSGSLLIDRLI